MGLAIADRWFERRQIDADLTLLWEPHVHPLLHCNIWRLTELARAYLDK